jgi:hypothetical protein
VNLALERSDTRRGALERRLGDPEVDDLHRPIEAEHQVVRSDVAVDEMERLARRIGGRMSVRERLTDLFDDPH